MNLKDFERVTEERLNACHSTLIRKGAEYATLDRLHNFKVAAAMQEIPVKQALWGMMAKHIVSLTDMCMQPDNYPLDLWDEKIGDGINYLLLLNAVVKEPAILAEREGC